MLRRLALPSVLVAAALAGCAPPPPHVFRVDEFDRNSKRFNKEPVDRSSVLICYNRNSAAPAEVRKLAEEACSKVGKTARFLRHEYDDCPLAIFSGARFSCDGGGVSGGGWSGQGTGVYGWSYTGPTEAPLLPPVPEGPAR
jgi:hypothetical protein